MSGERSSVCSDHVLGPCVYVVHFCICKKLCVNMCAFVRICVFCMWYLQVLVLSSSICNCVHPYMCVCVCARMRVCACAYVYVCVYVCVRVLVYVCGCARTCVRMCMCVFLSMFECVGASL